MKRIVLLCSLFILAALGVWSVAAQDGQSRAFLGVTVAEAENGARVEQVQADSPADQAGVRVGDVIVEVDGQAVTAASLRAEIAKHAVGDAVTVSVARGGETIDLEVTLAARPARQPEVTLFERALPDQPRLGVRLEDTDEGPVIREIVADSPAASASLEVGDIVKKVGDTAVENARAVVEAIQAQQVGDTIAIEIDRAGQTESVEVTLDAAPNLRPFRQGLEQLFSLSYDPSEKTWSIGGISEGNPLYEAGLREGDVITQFDGQAYDPAELRRYLRGLTDQNEITLTIQRDGGEQEITVPVDALSNLGVFGFEFGSKDGFNFPFAFGQAVSGARLGVEFLTLDDKVAEERNLNIAEGALVTQVVPDSPAAQAGLQENDIITAVNSEKVDAEHSLRDRLLAYEPGDSIKLDVIRDGETMELDVTLDQFSVDERFAPFFYRDGRGFRFQFPPEFPFQFPPDQQPEPVSPNI
jgi:S1-C subfamily serine protease